MVFDDNGVIRKYKNIKNSISICILLFCFSFGSDITAHLITRKIRVSELLYLSVDLGKKPTGEDAKIIFVGNDRATAFCVELVGAVNNCDTWNKQIVFVLGKSFNIPLLKDKAFCLGCDDNGALKLFLFPDSLPISTMPKTIKDAIFWENTTYCLKGSSLVSTVLKLSGQQIIVEHPFLDMRRFE